jgi:hypothetical protein
MFTVLGGKTDAAGLPALAEAVSQLRESACITVSHPNWEGQLFFEAGRLVSASLVTREGVSAVEALLQAVPDASFTFQRAITSEARPAAVIVDPDPRPTRPADWTRADPPPLRRVAHDLPASRNLLLERDANGMSAWRARDLLLERDANGLFAWQARNLARRVERASRHRGAVASVVLVALAGLLLALRPISAPRASPSDGAPVDGSGLLRDGWPNDPQGPAWLSDGGYQVTTRRPGQFVALGAPQPDVLSDVTVSATFHKVSGPSGSAYGIIVRDQGPGPRDGANQDGRFYLLAVNDRREAGVFRRESDRWIDLLPWRAADAVRSGNQSNALTASAVGDRLSLAVNGIEVAASQSDPTLGPGHVGIFVGGDNTQISLERFTINNP